MPILLCRVILRFDSQREKEPRSAEEACSPKTTATLDKAEAALKNSQPQEAATFAEQAVKDHESEASSCHGETVQRLESRIALTLAESRVANGKLLEALIGLEAGPELVSYLGCPHSTEIGQRCAAVSKALEKEFGSLFSASPSYKIVPYEVVFDNKIVVETLSVVDNHLEDKRKWLAFSAIPTQITNKPDGSVELKVEGSDADVGGTSWRSVGKVRVDSNVYDIKKGTYSVSRLKKALLVVHLPKEDAPIVKPGEAHTILVETKDWKRQGVTWTASNAHLAKVKPAR